MRSKTAASTLQTEIRAMARKAERGLEKFSERIEDQLVEMRKDMRELRAKDETLREKIGGVALPNDASVRLHEKFGFQKCAHFREVGFKFNRWIDVAYWERIL